MKRKEILMAEKSFLNEELLCVLVGSHLLYGRGEREIVQYKISKTF